MGDVIKMSFDNRVVIVSNYATEALNNELSYWGDRGFRLVSTEMAANTYHDVFWDGSGCNLLNNMEPCKFEQKDHSDGSLLFASLEEIIDAAD